MYLYSIHPIIISEIVSDIYGKTNYSQTLSININKSAAQAHIIRMHAFAQTLFMNGKHFHTHHSIKYWPEGGSQNVDISTPVQSNNGRVFYSNAVRSSNDECPPFTDPQSIFYIQIYTFLCAQCSSVEESLPFSIYLHSMDSICVYHYWCLLKCIYEKLGASLNGQGGF